MQDVTAMNVQSEQQFAAWLTRLPLIRIRCEQLMDLLREDHPLYDQRGRDGDGSDARLVLLALARVGVSDAALSSCSKNSTPE
jgi:hypothetical protein